MQTENSKELITARALKRMKMSDEISLLLVRISYLELFELNTGLFWLIYMYINPNMHVRRYKDWF